MSRSNPPTPKVLTALVTALLLLGWSDDGAAERLARCRRYCRPALEQCIVASPFRLRKARRVCRRQLDAACKRSGVSACVLPPSTTTTTTSTTLLSTTTTTTSTTSTTLPAAPSYRGTWHFVGFLASDTCGASGGLADTFTITQQGTSLTATVGSLPGVTLTGSVTVDGFELGGSFYDSGCLVTIALVVEDDGTVVLTAGTGFDITCGLTSCRSIWVGTIER
jgi:hypothetical protein